MKKLKGIKSFVSLEDKKLKDLTSVQGGTYLIRSNLPCPSQYPSGNVEYDLYESNGGKYLGRSCQEAVTQPTPGIGNWNGLS